MALLTKQKRAQITIFLIIGIILLFSSALLLYIRGKAADTPAEFQPVLQEVPLEAQPAKLYVEECVGRVTKRALRLIGLQGGYINVSDTQLSGKSFRLPPSGLENRPTEYDAMPMIEGSGSYIPYWWHMSSPNNCQSGCKFDSGMPNLYKSYGPNSIEAQVDEYVRREIGTCLGDYASLKQRGFEIEELNVEKKFDFRVGENDVAIYVEYPIAVESASGSRTEINNFFVRFDLNLKRIYTLAEGIANAEIDDGLLEWHLLNLITMKSYPLSSERLPPIAQVTLSYDDYHMWTRTETQSKLEQYVIPQGMATLSVLGTKNHVRNNILTEEGEFDAISTGIMDNMIFGFNTTEVFYDISANFLYIDWWPIYLNINNRELLKPTSMLNEYIPFNPKTYYFKYDVSFPVIIMLTQHDALEEDGEGYKFLFAMEGNLRKNRPMNTSYASVGGGVDTSPLMCKPNQRNSGLVNITIKDLYSDKPIDHARVDVKYGDFFCFIGFTSVNENGEAVLSDNFPVGSGEIKIYKEGYAPVSQRFGTILEEPGSLEIDMVPEQYVNSRIQLKVMSFMMGTGGLYQMLNPDDLDSDGFVMKDHQAILTLRRITDDAYKGYESIVMYNPFENGPNTTTRLIPGEYEVEGYYVRNDPPLVIPRKEYTMEIPFGEDETIVLNETIIENWLQGGIQLRNGNFITIPPEVLQQNKTIVFYMMRFPDPRLLSKEFGDAEDLTQPMLHEEYSSLYSQYLQPRFI